MKTPATHRGRRGSRAPASVDDGHGGYGSSYDDDDDDRSCLSPAASVSDLGYYQELALAAGESEGNTVPEFDIGDNGMPLSSTATATEIADDGKSTDKTPAATEVADDGKSADGRAQTQAGELTHVGAFWSRTGDVWRSEPYEQHESYVGDSYYHEYDDEHNYDDYDDDALSIH